LECQGVLLVPAGSSADCAYSMALDEPVDGTNTAIVTLDGIEFEATADYTFGDTTGTTTGETANISVDDSNIEGTPDWTTEDVDQATWDYTSDFVCPADDGQYVDGV